MSKLFEERTKHRQRLAEAIKMQEIEGNPFTSEDIAMFEMFEQKGWSNEQCRQYIIDLHDNEQSTNSAAE